MKRFTLSCSALAIAILALTNAPSALAQSTFLVGSHHNNSQFADSQHTHSQSWVMPTRTRRWTISPQGGRPSQFCVNSGQTVGVGQIWTGSDPSWPPAVQTQSGIPQQLVGTWEETYRGGRLTHQLSGNGLHTITFANGRTKQHMARLNGSSLQLLDGTYQISATGPQQIQLTTFQQTRTWTRPGISQFGGGGGGIFGGGGGGGTVSAGLPARMQGTWYDVDPITGNVWQYDFRGNGYDMYARDRQTGAVRSEGGELEQLLNSQLNYQNGILTLSPGPEQEGPFHVTPSSDGSQLRLQPVNGGPARLLTQQPRI